MKSGWVYILTNQAMPGLIKIGFTKNPPQERARELYGTGVAYPFEVVYQVRCYRYQQVERATHMRLAEKRVNGGREFFACSVHEAAQVIRECAGENLIEAENLQGGHERVGDSQTHHKIQVQKFQTASNSFRLRHYLLGSLMIVVVLLMGWVWINAGKDEDIELSETQKLIGYVPIRIGNEDINLRACSSTECSVVSVLPARQNILVKPDSRTAKNWVYAQFNGDVCYPEYYKRDKGCRQWAQNNIVEGWVYINNLQWNLPKKKNDSMFDALF